MFGVIFKKADTSRPVREIFLPDPKATLFDQVRDVLRFHHYSIRTERTYGQWIRRYPVFHRSTSRSGPQQGWWYSKEMVGMGELK